MKYKIVEGHQHGRDFVLGDLHGNYSYLKKFLQKVGFHQETDRLFLVGDLIDRGPESEKCLQLLLEPWVFAVPGNHEYMFLQMVHNDFTYLGLKDYWEESNGGVWTKKWFERNAPELKFWASVISELPFVIEVQGDDQRKPFWVVHAELWSPRMAVNHQNVQTLVETSDEKQINIFQWSRFIAKHRTSGKAVALPGPIYCGHTPTPQPGKTVSGHVNLDAGAGVGVFKEKLKITRPRLCLCLHNTNELFFQDIE